MSITISAFGEIPEFAKSYVKDMRVRWALAEAGLPYEDFLVSMKTKEDPQYLAWQPFGQVPAYRDDEVTMFESGAIVLRIAARCEALSPTDEQGRARVASWVFAALNSVEPAVMAVALADLVFGEEPWRDAYRAKTVPMLDKRLRQLADWLGDKAYLEGRFTAGDLMMVNVLRNVAEAQLASYPSLVAYRDRCLARPAYKKALAEHLAAFERAKAA